MKSGKTVSVGRVLWNILKKKKSVVPNLTIEDASEYALDCIRLLGAPAAYDRMVEKVKISNYKGALPSNLYNIRGVRYRDCEFCDFENAIAMREATDSFHTGKECNECNDDTKAGEFTYMVQQGVIVTSLSEGWVEIAYDGIVTDKQGFPMIPDEILLLKAIEYYIIVEYLEGLYATGKVTEKIFAYYQDRKQGAMIAAENGLKMPSVDAMESMSNALNRILIRTNWHDNWFKYFGEKERFKNYN